MTVRARNSRGAVTRRPLALRAGALAAQAAALACVAALCGATLGAASALADAGAAAAPDIGGFSAGPAHYDSADPGTRAYFVHRVKPGGSFVDEVLVSNTSTQPVTLYVNAVDGITGDTSGAVYANRGDPHHGASQWVTPSTGEVTVGAGKHSLVPFYVHVPRNATAGDHLAGLALQNVVAIRSPGKFSVIEIVRAVVGIEIQVPGPRIYRLSLGQITLEPLPGTKIPSAVVVLTNTGTMLCKPTLSVKLTGIGTNRTVTQKLDTILPGSQIPFPLPWPAALASGRYAAVVRATGCGPAVQEVRPTVEVAQPMRGTSSNPTAAVAAPPRALPRGAIPVWQIGLAGLASLILGVVLARRMGLRLRQRPAVAATNSATASASRPV